MARNLGLAAFKSKYDDFLQAHNDNGELHASNPHRNTEETWFLYEVDAANSIYAIRNWASHSFMSMQGNGACCPANNPLLGASEQWRMLNGSNYNVQNAVAFESVSRPGRWLGANNAGDNTPCGGEVCTMDNMPPGSEPNWRGWWIPQDNVTVPTDGRDFWNTVLDWIGGQLSTLNAADIATIITTLAAA